MPWSACQTARKPEQVRRRRRVGNSIVWICNAGHPRVNSSGDILEFPTKGGNQTVTGAQDSYWGQACDFAKLGLGSGPRFCDSQSTCRKKYSGKYRVIDFAKSQRLCRLL